MIISAVKRIVVVIALTIASMAVTASEGEYTLSPSFKKSFAIIQQWISQDKSEQSLTRLNSLSNRNLNPYEHALVAQTRGFLLAQNDDYSSAIMAFEEALKTRALPKDSRQRLHYNLGQLYMAQEKFSLGIQHLETWLASDEKGEAAVYSWIGYAYYQLKNYQEAENILKEALIKYSPLREWYQVLSAIYLDSKRYSDSVILLKQAIAIFPDDHFLWRQLASSFLYAQKEMDALTVLMLSKEMDAYESYDIPLMAQLFRRIGAPYYGAKLIQSAIDSNKIKSNYSNYRLLAECLSQARDNNNAIHAYEKAAEYTKDGDMYFRSGELLIGLERWKEAENSLSRSLERGIKNPGQAYYLKGISQHEQGKLAASLASFRKALADKHVHSYAAQWIKRLEVGLEPHKG